MTASFASIGRRHLGWWTLLLVLLLTLAGMARAQTGPAFPKFTGLVVDAANRLSPQTRADLTRKLEALQRDTQRQLVVATIPNLQGYPLEDYGYRLGRAWGVGLKDVNNGAILFIAPNEPAGHRGPRLEVGRGLEGFITDAFAYDVTANLMTPKLKAGDVDGAMEAGTDAVIQQLRANPDEAKARTDAAAAAFDKAHRRTAGGGSLPLGLIIILFVIGFMILSRFRRRSYGTGWSGRGTSGGGGGWPIVLWGPGWGGGGSSWGGGSSFGGSSWSSGSDSGSDGSWGGGGFTGGGGGDFGGGGASGDW